MSFVYKGFPHNYNVSGTEKYLTRLTKNRKLFRDIELFRKVGKGFVKNDRIKFYCF